jgi:hypothetical protein
MYHNAAWCFYYDVYLLYIIDYTVEYDKLFSIMKPDVTHTILSGLPCPNHNPALFLTLILLTWKIWWANNANRLQMVFNSAFKGLMLDKHKKRQKQTTLSCGKNALPCNMLDALWFI